MFLNVNGIKKVQKYILTAEVLFTEWRKPGYTCLCTYFYCLLQNKLMADKSLNKDLQHDEQKVLILGAGVAGIVAAKTLQENGINDFLILEAQDYIGGRFKQRSFAGVKLEEGANWIHYADNKLNPLCGN